jgi:predicted phage terminase large subunit-like protein
VTAVALTPDLVESFAGAYLSPMYDSAVPTPQFHRTCWQLYCEPITYAAVAAPRGHAKSTALTHDFGLATALFRVEDYIVIVSATEDLAIQHLGDIATELRENEDIIRDFQIDKLVTDAKTDIIVRFKDGHECRFIAKGSGQKMRGIKWRGKRPGLIICDDLEEDEQVESRDRRLKFGRWFRRALLPCLRKGGKVRMHGTILHEEALLARVIRGKVDESGAALGKRSWKTRLFKAHRAFDDFTDILWPEQFSEQRLREIQNEFVSDGDSAGYSQEYLNDPRDNAEAYLRREDFLPMRDEHRDAPKRFNVGCDFAVSKADTANRTCFTVGGTTPDNTTCLVDNRVGRWDTSEWIEVMFEIEARWKPETFFVEDGVIWKAISPVIYREMRLRGKWLNCMPILPVKDKATRGRSYQKRLRAGSIRVDKDTSWWPGFEAENLAFTGQSEARLDDQFDAPATLFLGLDRTGDLDEEDFENEDEMEMRRQDPRLTAGRSSVTGY